MQWWKRKARRVFRAIYIPFPRVISSDTHSRYYMNVGLPQTMCTCIKAPLSLSLLAIRLRRHGGMIMYAPEEHGTKAITQSVRGCVENYGGEEMKGRRGRLIEIRI